VGVRKATIHSGSPVDHWIEYQEGIVINQPGTIPEDNINYDAVTYANLAGKSKTFTWTEDGGPGFDGAPDEPCIQVINFKNPHKPFSVVDPDGVKISPYGGHGKNSHFNWWNHWPVAQEKSDTTVAESADRPSHSSLAHIKWKEYSRDGISRTWIMLHGMTKKKAADLGMLAKSWLNPAALIKTNGPFSVEGYDPTERAYKLNLTAGKPARLQFKLDAGEDSPVVNFAIVVKNWGPAGASITLDGRKLEDGRHCRTGHVYTLEGTDLVAWVRAESIRPLKVTVAAR
jgi:hypothetical protein